MLLAFVKMIIIIIYISSSLWFVDVVLIIIIILLFITNKKSINKNEHLASEKINELSWKALSVRWPVAFLIQNLSSYVCM